MGPAAVGVLGACAAPGGEARDTPDFDAIAAAVRNEKAANRARKIALNTAQWTTQEGRDAHSEQAPWYSARALHAIFATVGSAWSVM